MVSTGHGHTSLRKRVQKTLTFGVEIEEWRQEEFIIPVMDHVHGMSDLDNKPK